MAFQETSGWLFRNEWQKLVFDGYLPALCHEVCRFWNALTPPTACPFLMLRLSRWPPPTLPPPKDHPERLPCYLRKVGKGGPNRGAESRRSFSVGQFRGGVAKRFKSSYRLAAH